MGSSSLFSPLLKACGKVLGFSSDWMWKPFEKICDGFSKLPNAGLFFCGFSVILIPLIIAFFAFFLGVLLAEVIIFATLGFLIGSIFVLIGIWPSFIITVGITGITIIRLPLNIYYHCLITYRTVMLRQNIKLLSFILLPLIHLLIPSVTFILALVVLIPWFAAIAFSGFPHKPWIKIQSFHAIAWKKFATDVERISQNYGHASGIPMNWDGSIYGLPVDPIAVILSIFLYLISVLPVTIGVFVIFAVKALPIFMGTLKEFWKSINISKSVNWYRRVLTGNEAETPHTGSTENRTRSGHTAWSSKLKRSTKGIKKFIEGYANIKICDRYCKIMKNYAKYVEKIHPQKLAKLTVSYMTDLSPLKIAPSKLDFTILCLWFPILLTTIMWILGLILVLTIPPATFLIVFLIWLVCWLFVISLPPIIYIAGWIFIIFGIPILYIILWCLILLGPWIFVALGSVSGPLLALKIPFTMLTSNYYNPVEMWSNMRRGLAQVPRILRKVDRVTASLSIGNIKVIKGNSEEGEKSKEERGKIDYWSLYITRCIKESRKIQTLGWLSQDDIMAASSTSTIAIPGVAIIAVFVDSIKRSKKDKTLIYWNEENKCKDSNRDYTDNVANVFWPQLMKVKDALMTIEDDLDSQATWISASLCDGEDEKSDQLRNVLDNLSMSDADHQKCLRIRAMVENIVHSLLRVNAMTSRMNKIFLASDDEEEL